MDPVAAQSDPTIDRASRFAGIFRCAAWISSATLLAFVTACYWRRDDVFTLITLFPPWCWAAIGMLLAALTFSRRRWRRLRL